MMVMRVAIGNTGMAYVNGSNPATAATRMPMGPSMKLSLHADPKSPTRLDPKEAATGPSQTSDALSPEALSALEVLLSQAHHTAPPKRRRRSFGAAVLNKLRRRRHESPGGVPPLPDTGITRQLLLQIGDAVSALAAGELEENPRIDPRTWEAVQKTVRAS